MDRDGFRKYVVNNVRVCSPHAERRQRTVLVTPPLASKQANRFHFLFFALSYFLQDLEMLLMHNRTYKAEVC